MRLSIIVLSYNTKDLTKRCIDAIVSQYKKQIESGDLEIIVVDNASTDRSVASIKSQISNLKSQIKIIENEENFGFSKGNNIGAKKAKGKFILFLNSDTEIKDERFLKMVEFFEKNPRAGILGGKLLNPDGSQQASCGNFYTLGNCVIMLLGGERFGLVRKAPKKIEQVDWVSGACFMIRKNLFQKLGGFDENFFMYIEDMEFCFRAKKSGFSTYFYPDIKLIHKELASSNRAFAISQIYKGLLYFYKKHMNYGSFLLIKFLLILKATVAILLGKNDYRGVLKFAV